ncbi:MAG: RloB domain-containing protein [Saprospiraceae bacterium]|nr:RloB domain-containing protein [Saprospiraceae bacterium]MCB9326353.1 RloB domain-containing protein [Lewinellaceae bacterium]
MPRSKRKKRKLIPRILIMCEGETERNYFQAIKEDKQFKRKLSALVPYVVKSKHPTPETVVQEALKKATEEKMQGNDFEKVWVVFDHDNSPKRKIAYNEALKNNFDIAFSAISFEVWFLIHFLKTSKSFKNSKEVVGSLKKYYPEYKKASNNDFAFLKKYLQTAFKNAEWLRIQNSASPHPTDRTMWVDVDILVLELIT